MQIKTFKPKDHKIKALIYGAAGSGKTVFAGTAEKAIYASAEGGLLSIADKMPEFMEIKSLKDLHELYQYLLSEEHGYETVVIDSISEINEMIKLEIEKRLGRAMQLQDWGELSKKVRDLFRKFRDLPMHVILIAQEQYMDDEGRIKKIVPSMNGKAATEIAYFMDIVGYINIEADGSRWIETNSNKKLLTKDRSNMIGNDAPMDFTEWQKRVSKIETGEQTVKTTYAPATPKPAAEPPKPGNGNHPHLLELQLELKNRGAVDMPTALKILNEACHTKYENLNFSEAAASSMLVMLLQLPDPNKTPTEAPAKTRVSKKSSK